MPDKSFPELEVILRQFYPLLDSNGWVENEFEETGEKTYEIECDNFPVQIDDLTLYLEAVFHLVPVKSIFLIETYTTLFESFPTPPYTDESVFLEDLRSNKKFVENLVGTFAPNHPVTAHTSKEIEVIYTYWKETQKHHEGGGRIIFPDTIRIGIKNCVQRLFKTLSWNVMMYAEYLDLIPVIQAP